MHAVLERALASIRRSLPDRESARRNLLSAAACAIGGKLGLLLAFPGSHVADVRPSAGIALAVVLLFGAGVWPWVLLGTAIAHLGITPDASASSASAALCVPILVGVADAAEAVVAAALVRRFGAFSGALSEASEVLRLLTLGGPICATIGASISVVGLRLFGVLPASETAFAWGTWWIGNAIGAALFAPLLLLWCAGPEHAGLRRKLSVTGPLGMVFALTMVLFFQVGARERERASVELERRVHDVGTAVERGFDGSLGVLASLGSFYDASRSVDQREFGTFARFALSRSRTVRSLSWCPRVKDGERPGCTRMGRLEVDPAFAILERDAAGRLVPAASRPEYAPVFYAETADKSERLLGYDAISDPLRREAWERARDTGDIAATAPLPLGKDGASGMIVYRPVYGYGEPHETPLERKRCLVGCIAAEFRIDDLVREALNGAETEGLRLRLYDLTESTHPSLLFARPTRNRVEAGAERTASFEIESIRPAPYRVGGRAWELQFAPDADRAAPRRGLQAWFVLAAGFLVTGLLEAFLLVGTGRSDAIEALVARRTAELEQANVDLRHEVAERARAEAKHQSSELRLAAAQQLAHIGSFELDLATGDVLWSDELSSIHGVDPGTERVPYEECLARIHPEDRERVGLAFEAAVRDHKPFAIHHRIVRPDLDVRALHVRGEVVLDPAGAPIRIHGTGQDVTELERAERELARRTRELERSNAELERFAYVASHDLQEPLRAVASHVQILEQDYKGRLDSEADLSIRCAVEGAQRMHDLINDYLAYSRVRNSTEPHGPASTAEALESAMKNLERAIADSSAVVTRDPMPEVLGDPTQLAQLFQNLVANAVKFRGDDAPRVHVAAARAGSTWLFSISDNGIGIDPEHTRRIFTLFQRLHTQDRYPGTGIGLAICKKIVDRHGGRIWVESMPGMGATFRFTLPACPEAVVSPPVESPEGLRDSASVPDAGVLK